MHGKLAMICFQYQVYLYGRKPSHAFLRVVTEPALSVIRLPPPPTTGSPPPSLYGSITFTHLEDNYSMVENLVEEPSHVKQLSQNHVCKRGLIIRVPCSEACYGMMLLPVKYSEWFVLTDPSKSCPNTYWHVPSLSPFSSPFHKISVCVCT